MDPTYKIIEVYGLEAEYFRKKEAFGQNQEVKSFVFPDLTIEIDKVFNRE